MLTDGSVKLISRVELLRELQQLIQERRIGAGIELLTSHAAMLEALEPGDLDAGWTIGSLAQWLDVGFEDGGLLGRLVARFAGSEREQLPLGAYVHIRLAEAVLAMRREDLNEALRHLDTALKVSEDLEDNRNAAIATLWKARCLRKAGEYDQALEVTRRGFELANASGFRYLAAVVGTLESWLLFQKGRTKEAINILQDAEAVLRHTDDLITLGNIQSTYGRIALREGRYDHAVRYFEASIDLFQRRPALEGYLARSLTNIAQAKRFMALQLRRSIDARHERLRAGRTDGQGTDKRGLAAQLERMHELLRRAQADLAQADAIYKKAGNHHGAGNVDVSLAQIHLDLGDLDEAEKRAAEAFELGATKADHLLMCRARIVEAMVANARYEEQIGEAAELSRFAQLAHDCAKEAVDLGERTESRRLLAQAHICLGTTHVNGFFSNTEAARACCDRAEAFLDHDRHDALWQEVELLRARILYAGIEDPNLRAWSQGEVGNKSLQEVVADFEELVIRRVWEHEGRKVSRVATKLSVSPKKVRRVLRHLGLLSEQQLREEEDSLV
jgi:tetratricopeptide (TPR) repeat protein